MQGQHDLADLAPRDIVAKAILRRMRETGTQHVWLDARHFGAEKWRGRVPTIHQALLSLGIDPVRGPIPVVPACHYARRGAAADGIAALAEHDGGAPGTETWETTNLLTVSAALVQAAGLREETRGAHWRDDFPDRDDARWRGHLDTVLSPDGTLLTDYREIT